MNAPQTAPSPLLGALNQIRPQSVALDVTANGEEMGVLLRDEGLEASLIQVPGSGGRVMSMPALHVRESYKAYVIGEASILLRPQNQVPVIRHQTPRKYTHGNTVLNIREDALECQVVRILFEYGQACVGTIEDVVYVPARCIS
jgi:hypothetical protein